MEREVEVATKEKDVGSRRKLTFKRHFSREGVHPFDEIEWELRDAVIPNYKEGGNAFEQRGVEFPKSWSQNATNIVAQKYFRGLLGTPERESSVRQMIGRVVDTIAGWGVKEGYFDSDADARAFADELTAILVTQRAAFNSPVWFNVGVPDTPQQCSACFILAVEDTMASILNWYVEEGTIFKGGSGSGINLSALRSSKEQLQGGGTASGPVSFMRGADASAGTIKCLHEDTELVTDRGVKPIRDVRSGFSVLTRWGFRRVEAAHDNGVRPLVRVRTALGDEILCTPEHRFRVRTDQGEVWREAGSLRPDDYALIDLGQVERGSPQELASPPAGHFNEIPYDLPRTLDEPLAMWLGWVFGDGSITERPGAKYIAVQIGDDDPELVDRYLSLTRAVFGSDAHVYVNRRPARDDASASVRIASSRIIRYLDVNGLRKQRAAELRIPGAIASSPAGVRAAFLAGLFEADGHVGNGFPWLSTVSNHFARDVHRLLLSLGIPSLVGCITDRRGAYGSKPIWTVRIVGGEGVRRFAKLVGFVSERKSRLMEAAQDRKDASPFETQWVLPHVSEELDAIWRSTRNPRLRRDLAPYTRYSARRRMSLLRARILVERFPEELERSSLARFATGQDFYVQVSVGPAEDGRVFDLTVEGVHEYLVDNLVTHNSGGKTRRAAKMVILNVDHPDIRDFIWCKAVEERKARVLRDAGFDMDLDGKDSYSMQYQNANNSVRVTDEFMKAYQEDRDWKLKAVQDGRVLETVRAKDLMREIAQAAWECADPGMQYDTTINDWHTAPASGRINASNPCCFVGETLVATVDGAHRMDALEKMAEAGHELPRVRAYDLRARKFVWNQIRTAWVAGYTDRLIEVVTAEGLSLQCTPEHRFLLTSGEYIQARDLEVGAALVGITDSGQPIQDRVVRSLEVRLDLEVPVFDLEVDGVHNFAVSDEGSGSRHSVVVHNSEYMHLDNSACNLASLNLLKFLDEDGTFDVAGFKHAVEVVFTAQEIIVGNSSYPTEKIERNAKAFRQLGLGYANLGALLMARGLPYDSDAGRAWGGVLTALMTGHAYRTSAQIASAVGPFAGYAPNRDAVLRIIRKHRAAADDIDAELVPEGLLQAAKRSWDEAIALGEEHGYRNAQASVLAPTGTISFLLDCDTTGIEPDLALVKTKKLVGGGTMQIVNQTVPRALRKLGYTENEARAIVAYLGEHNSVVGAPYLKEAHYPVFDCSMGDRAIHYMGHVRMMAAAQPFISGAISKTINMPEHVTVEEVEQMFVEGWKLGLKAIAIYRDNCKVAQPLSAEKKKATAETVELPGKPIRRRLPSSRPARTISFAVGDAEGYITAGEYPEDGIGEIFLKVSKQGSTLSGVMDAFAIAVSLGLQYGVPLEAFAQKFVNMRFEPSGITNDPDIRFGSSIVDYVFRRLALEYLPPEKRAGLGVQSIEERKEYANGVLTGAAEPAAGPEAEADAAQPRLIPLSEVPERETRVLDAPLCYSCGAKMQPAGSCYVCTGCGSTSGCS